MYKPVPQVLPHDDDSENEWDTSLYLDQRFLVNDGNSLNLFISCIENMHLACILD